MLILSFELRDDPGVEHEVEVTSITEAQAALAQYEDHTLWHSLTDSYGRELELVA